MLEDRIQILPVELRHKIFNSLLLSTHKPTLATLLRCSSAAFNKVEARLYQSVKVDSTNIEMIFDCIRRNHSLKRPNMQFQHTNEFILSQDVLHPFFTYSKSMGKMYDRVDNVFGNLRNIVFQVHLEQDPPTPARQDEAEANVGLHHSECDPTGWECWAPGEDILVKSKAENQTKAFIDQWANSDLDFDACTNASLHFTRTRHSPFRGVIDEIVQLQHQILHYICKHHSYIPTLHVKGIDILPLPILEPELELAFTFTDYFSNQQRVEQIKRYLAAAKEQVDRREEGYGMRMITFGNVVMSEREKDELFLGIFGKEGVRLAKQRVEIWEGTAEGYGWDGVEV